MGRWGRSIEQFNLDDAVRATGKIATSLEAVPLDSADQPISVVFTKFGGNPYAEAGDVWPTFRDRPYDFVAQFNLRESFSAPTDSYELITVFVSWMVLEELQDTDSETILQKSCLIRSYKNPTEANAITLARPAPMNPADYRVVPCGVKSHRVISYPSPFGSSFLKIDLIQKILTRQRDGRFMSALKWFLNCFSISIATDATQSLYLKCLQRVAGRDWRLEETRIGGYPSWTQSSPFDDDDDLFFVVQISDEPLANFCIGDGGPLVIAAHVTNPEVFECDPWQTH